jgi:hypothetical protein
MPFRRSVTMRFVVDRGHLPINCATQHRIARQEAKFRVTIHFGLV